MKRLLVIGYCLIFALTSCTSRPEDNEIWYTTTDSNAINISGYGIVSNTYKDGKGVLTFDEPVTRVSNHYFRGNDNLTSITIPNSVTSIGDSAFYGCTSLTSITIPDSVTSIGSYAFHQCTSLTSVTIPDSVSEIGYDAFYNCTSLKSVTIPNSVTSIGYGAFKGCISLTSVTIGSGVTSIGESAFEDCTSLEEVYCLAEIAPDREYHIFYNNAPYRKIYVPYSFIYRYTNEWCGWYDNPSGVEYDDIIGYSFD